MQVLVDARDKLDIPWEHPTTVHAADQAILFHSSNELDVETFREYAPYINRLWQDRAIKKAYDRRREFQLVRTKVISAICMYVYLSKVKLGCVCMFIIVLRICYVYKKIYISNSVNYEMLIFFITE